MRCRALVIFTFLLAIPAAAPAAESSQSPTNSPDSPPLTITHTTLASPHRLRLGEQIEIRLEAPFPFRSVGVWWKAGENQDSLMPRPLPLLPLPPLPRLTVSAITISGIPTETHPVVENHDLATKQTGPTGQAREASISGLIHWYEPEPRTAIMLTITGPVDLEEISIIWIGDAAGPADAPDAITSPTLDPMNYPKPPVNSRADWGADPPQCEYWYCTTTHIAIHHTASASEYDSPGWSQCAANVRATQAYHMYTRGWCDIGYNFLICVHGQIWEGRGGGNNVGGAHDGHNCGSMGVSLMGYFHPPYNHILNAEMIQSIAELSAWKCDQQGIDPWGNGWYEGYNGSMTNIFGHRDVGQTSCPGDLAYAELDTIRGEIDTRLQGGGIDLILDNDRAHFIGIWNTGTMSNDKYGHDYRWASTGTEKAVAYWRPMIPEAGRYVISLWWPEGANRSPLTTIGARINGQPFTSTVNQQQNGGRWNILGETYLRAGSSTILIGLNNNGPGDSVVVCDALRLTKVR